MPVINSRGGIDVTLTGLLPNTRYAMVVQAYNSKGAGPSSPAVTIQTLEDSESRQYVNLIAERVN